MYVKTTTMRRGDKTYSYLSLVEAVREGTKVKHRVLLRLGEVTDLRESGQLDRIIAALRQHAEGTWLSGSELSSDGAPSFGAMAAIHTYFTRLGLDRHFAAVGRRRKSVRLATTLYALVANRLCDPASKRRTVLEWLDDVALPAGVEGPSLDRCYRALDALSASKQVTEEALFSAVTDLTNLDLRLCCYDLTSTYFETDGRASSAFVSRAFGYSRDHRGDRPQVMIGLLVTADGIPIAHHVFPGNTNDASTLKGVLSDLKERFSVRRIALVADRGVMSAANVSALGASGFDHVMATRLHMDPDVAAVLGKARGPDQVWVPVPEARSGATEVEHDGQRYVVVFSPERFSRDNRRREEILTETEDTLSALEERVRSGRLRDPAKIGAAAQRILSSSPMARVFVTHMREGAFSWDYDQEKLRYETEDLAGRYVLTTSLSKDQASTARIVLHYRSLQRVEDRFKVMKDFLGMRPVFHFTEERVRGHIALCVIAAVIESLMAIDLERAGVMDPDLPHQVMTPRRALHELGRVRVHELTVGDRRVEVVTRRNGLQGAILSAMHVDTAGWDRAAIA